MNEGTRVAMYGRCGTVVATWPGKVYVHWDGGWFSWVRVDDVSRVA